MTHMNPMPDSAGHFSQPEETQTSCRRCEEPAVSVQVWESNCGSYTDYKFTCAACGYQWWVDGPDA